MMLGIMCTSSPAGRRQYAYRTPTDDLPITGRPPGDNMNIGRWSVGDSPAIGRSLPGRCPKNCSSFTKFCVKSPGDRPETSRARPLAAWL